MKNPTLVAKISLIALGVPGANSTTLASDSFVLTGKP
jgi:hypothetical protein